MRYLRSAAALLRGRSGFATVAQTGLTTAFVLLLNMGTGVVSARFLGPVGRGELAALMLCPQLLCFLFTFGLSASLVVLIRKDPAKERVLMGAALAICAAAGLLAVITGALLIPRLIGQYTPEIQSQARWLLVFVLLGVTQSAAWPALQIRDRFGTYNRARFWQTAAILVSLTVLVLVHRISPLTASLAYLLPTLPYTIWCIWWAFKEMRPSLTGLRAHTWELLSFGARIHLVDIGSTLFAWVDKLILVALLSPALFGTYVVVFNLSRLITTFGASVVPVLLPRAAGKPVPELLESTSRALVATALLNAVAVLGFLCFGRVILQILYGAKFSAGYLTLLILSAEAALTGMATILQQPYLMLSRPGIVALSHIVSLAVGGALIYALGARFGMEGAACGLLCGTGLRTLLTYGGYRWLLGVSAPRFVPTRR
ncbi:MAG TPA: lipopolysaccharide biosynthesis protein, partial [Steroidobacteraceae bacterium]|nr:lipopolysaccharide biosynthesis protein [Steroidobacteraceae bacterium]